MTVRGLPSLKNLKYFGCLGLMMVHVNVANASQAEESALKLSKQGLNLTALAVLDSSADSISSSRGELHKSLSLYDSLNFSKAAKNIYSTQAVQLAQTLSHSGAQEYVNLKKKYLALEPSQRTASLRYDYAASALLADQTKTAVDELKSIIDQAGNRSEIDGVEVQKIRLLLARANYQLKDFNSALSHYNLIPQDSDYWFETIEERAWAYLQLKEPQKALGQLKTVTAEVFDPAVGPEPYFLNAYILMKLCDYKGVFELLNKFKAQFKERALNMQKLSKTGSTPSSDKALDEFFKSGKSEDVGADIKFLPRLFYRDEAFARKIQLKNRIESELKKIDGLSGELKNTAQAQVPSLKALLSKISSQISKSEVRQKVKELAIEETQEISKILQKMHIIEAESIQRLFSYHQKQANIKGDYKEDLNKNKDSLVFEATDEVWLDELDKYQVEVKGCPTSKEISK